MSDPAIEQLEAELRESRFKAWDVETFLANRHQAKIDALTAPAEGNAPGRLWRVVKELTVMVCAFVGYITIVTVTGLWLLTGE